MDETVTKRAIQAEPARLWRNWYRSLVDHIPEHGSPKRAGEEWPGYAVFATREEAESTAQVFDELRQWAADVAGESPHALYLGARQEDD